MGDEIVSKYNTIASEFQQQSENLLTEISKAFSQAVEVASANYASIQDTYSKGYLDIAKQASQVSTEMTKNLETNMQQLRDNLKQLCEQLQKNFSDAYEQSMKQFKEQCEDILKKFPDLDRKIYKDACTFLESQLGKTKTSLDSQFKLAMGQLEQKYNGLKDEISVPEIKPLQIHKLEITKVSEPRTSAGSSAAPAPRSKK